MTPPTGWIPTDTFALRLRLLRHEKGLTMQEAADRSALSRATWRTWENGASPRDKDVVVAKIAKHLNVDRDWLMWGGPLRSSSTDTTAG